MILAFGFGLIVATIALYFAMCRPDEREIFNAGYDAGYLDAMRDVEDKKDADSFI